MNWENLADRISMLGMAIVAGWILCSGYYRITHLWRQQDRLEHCVQAAVPVAKQAITAAKTDEVPVPDPARLKPCRNFHK